MAAGDIACAGDARTPTACHQQQTSDLLAAQRDSPEGLAAVLALGDNQYESGSLTAYDAYFGPTWGRFDDILHPAPGNHEYNTPGAQGYYDYFLGAGKSSGAVGDRGKGYYSFDIGAWHLIALNSNCGDVGGCQTGSPQDLWLRNDLATHPAPCTLAFFHHGLFSSGEHGRNEGRMHDMWQTLYDAGADLVLVGHDHDYERFAPQTADGQAAPGRGIREFVVGTGGRSLYSFRTTAPNSEVRDAGAFGVLKLILHRSGYDWRFVPEPGAAFADAGSDRCHHGATVGGATPPPPPAASHGGALGGPQWALAPPSAVPGVARVALRAPARQSLRGGRVVRVQAWTDMAAKVIEHVTVISDAKRYRLRPILVALAPGPPQGLARRIPLPALRALRRAARRHRPAAARFAIAVPGSGTRAAVTIGLRP
jgi:hypothetical protein